jgi:hypothetical protein
MACLQPPLVSILKTGSQGFSPFPIEPELDVYYLINKKKDSHCQSHRRFLNFVDNTQ